jgi:hypothetical protein
MSQSSLSTAEQVHVIWHAPELNPVLVMHDMRPAPQQQVLPIYSYLTEISASESTTTSASR